jgi:hypothetical protein
MDLTRTAANRKAGLTTAFSGRKPSVTIDESSGAIKLGVTRAEGMGTQGQYDYTVLISPDDLAAILSTISTSPAPGQKGKLQESLASSAVPLLRLLSAASALPSQLAPSASEKILDSLKKLSKRQSASDA